MTSRLLDTLGTTDALRGRLLRSKPPRRDAASSKSALARAEGRLRCDSGRRRGRDRRIRRCERIRYRSDRRAARGPRAPSRSASFRRSQPGCESADATSARATCTGARRARTSRTPRWCCCLGAARALLGGDHAGWPRRCGALSDDTPTRDARADAAAAGAADHVRAQGRADGTRHARAAGRACGAPRDALVLQFGGAAGTLAALGDRGARGRGDARRELGLAVPTRRGTPQRDRLAALVAACGVYAGSLGKIARDVALLMQAEVAEAASRAADRRRCRRSGTRSGARWPWPRRRGCPDFWRRFSRACRRSTNAASAAGMRKGRPSPRCPGDGRGARAMNKSSDSLRVDAASDAHEIAATGGAVFAERAMMLLARSVGRDTAHHLVREAATSAAADGRAFVDALAAIPQVRDALTAAELNALADPDQYLGVARSSFGAICSAAHNTSRFIHASAHAPRPSGVYRLEGRDDLPVAGVVAFARPGSRHVGRAGIRFARDFRVLSYDIRGHGASGVTAGDYRVEQLARRSPALLDALGIDRVALCGLSLGGMIGMWLATHAPERLTALVLANTSPRPDAVVMEARRTAVLQGGWRRSRTSR